MIKKSKSFPGTIFIFSLWLLAMIIGVFVWNMYNSPTPQSLEGVLRFEPKPISSFQLVDHHGKTFDTKRLKGKWSFVFFGYTFCPDICPTTLVTLTAMQKQLLKKPQVWSDTQVLFVSVDPGRDTREKLASYMDFFNKDFIAATGEKDQIDNLAGQFGAGYIIEPKKAQEIEQEVYLVSHSAAIFLVDPQARVVASFSQPHNPNTIASLFREIREFF